MIEKFGSNRSGAWVDALAQVLESMGTRLGGDNALEVERQAKAVSALIRAKRDLDEYAALQAGLTEQDEEELRAELRRRIARFVEADLSEAPAEVLERLANSEAAP